MIDYSPPTDRDLVYALLDAVMTLSNRLYPDDLMQVVIRNTSSPDSPVVSLLFPGMTRFIPRAALSCPSDPQD